MYKKQEHNAHTIYMFKIYMVFLNASHLERFVDLCRVHIVFSVYASVDQKNIENNP